MSLQDPISDMLTRIRNAQNTKKKSVSMPSSKVKVALVDVLYKEGYLESFEVTQMSGKTILTVYLKYYDGQPVISEVRRISRPGLRVYRDKKNLPQVLNGLGIALLTLTLTTSPILA